MKCAGIQITFILSSDLIYSYPITGLDRALGLREVEAPRISKQSTNEDGRFVSPTHRPHSPSPRRHRRVDPRAQAKRYRTVTKTTMHATDSVRLCLSPLHVYEVVGTSLWEYLMSWSVRETNVKCLSLFGTYFRDLIASLLGLSS